MTNYENSFKQLKELKNVTLKDLHIDFIKLIVSVSVLLVPLISLLLPESAGDKALFRCLLLSLLVCILSGVANLYIILIQHRKMAQDLNHSIIKSMDLGTRVQPIYSKYNGILKWSEYLSVITFSTSVILIVCIAW